VLEVREVLEVLGRFERFEGFLLARTTARALL